MTDWRLGARGRAWLLLLAVVPVTCWVAWESQRLFRADWASAAARHNVSSWVSGEAKPESFAEWEAARSALQASLDITADDPDLQERMGDLYIVAGQRNFADPTLRHQHFAHAAAYYEIATRLRPGEPQAWAMLATSYQAMGENRALMHAAWARAVELGPYEGDVQPVLVQLVLSDWNAASTQMQNWAKSLFDNGNANTRGAINRIAGRFGLIFTPDDASRRR